MERQQQHHRFYLWLAAIVVVLAFALTVQDNQRVALRPLPHFALPESCPSKIYFGIDCPGCGLTRSFIHLAAGNLAASFSTHRVGWLMALAILGQFPYRWFALHKLRRFPISSGRNTAESRPVESRILFKTPAWIECFAKLLLVALLGNWILTVLGY